VPGMAGSVEGSGGRGIRTLEGVNPPTRFPGVSLRPLGQATGTSLPRDLHVPEPMAFASFASPITATRDSCSDATHGGLGLDTISALATSTLHVRGSVELVDGNVYLAMSLRNVGNGTAVLQGWRAAPRPSELVTEASDPAAFRKQLRDLYVPAGDVGFWQAAIRDASDPDHGWLQEHIKKDALHGRTSQQRP
jgi:hypothetical protein